MTSVGASNDCALAEMIIGLCNTKEIRRQRPWRHVEHVEFATNECVNWFNYRQLLEPVSHHIPPGEFEQPYDHPQESPAKGAGLR